MPTWLRSIVNAILGKVPGKTGRPDSATRMAMDADFSRRESTPPVPGGRERDDRHLVKPTDPLANVDLLEELIRIVNEAQARDAEDERRLYDPMLRDRPWSFQGRRPQFGQRGFKP
jgi:hypothetical protein